MYLPQYSPDDRVSRGRLDRREDSQDCRCILWDTPFLDRRSVTTRGDRDRVFFRYRGKLEDRFKLMVEHSTRGRVCLYLEHDRSPERRGVEQAERKRIVRMVRGSNSLQ